MVQRVLVHEGIGDVEQQARRGSELQFELLIRLVRGECSGHGRYYPRENLETKAIHLTKRAI